MNSPPPPTLRSYAYPNSVFARWHRAVQYSMVQDPALRVFAAVCLSCSASFSIAKPLSTLKTAPSRVFCLTPSLSLFLFLGSICFCRRRAQMREGTRRIRSASHTHFAWFTRYMGSLLFHRWFRCFPLQRQYACRLSVGQPRDRVGEQSRPKSSRAVSPAARKNTSRRKFRIPSIESARGYGSSP